eukprot:TRINITY_DN28013_c0_g2_i1.p1 TRINITY_DN28013_c0_g2~~TRINITY_DN28013_c0_g2_i1.p1  ORF type:complete len:372 (-),score=37.21 TRINITY_DN28013_c0_g2_i1:66-1181(-)
MMLMLLFFSLQSCFARADFRSRYSLTSGSKAGVVRHTVFKPGDAGMSCYRIPAVIVTAKDTLLAFAEARQAWQSNGLACGDGDVHGIAVSRSTDNGVTWSDVSFVAGGVSTPVGNPYPIALSEGKVVLIFVNHTRQSAGVGPDNGMVISNDDGITWGAASSIGAGFGAAKGAMPGPGAGVQLRDSKRLLVVSHMGAYKRDYISFSDDAGQTWASVNTTFPGMDEATLADLGGGHVILNMRHRLESAKGRAVSRSVDGGLTWSSVSYDAALIGPVCQGSLAAIGSSLYFSNPASKTRRDELRIRRSDDGGRTWPSSLLIQKGSSAGYSSLVPGRIGGVNGSSGGILFESTTAGSIDFSTFSLSFDRELFIVV